MACIVNTAVQCTNQIIFLPTFYFYFHKVVRSATYFKREHIWINIILALCICIIYHVCYKLPLSLCDDLTLFSFSERANFQKQNKTTADQPSQSKSKRWSGQISPCKVCMKTPQTSALRWGALSSQLTPSRLSACVGDWSKIYNRKNTDSFLKMWQIIVILIKSVSLFWYQKN